jgi:hypothetical protein
MRYLRADGSAEARTPRDTEVFQRMSSCVTVDSVRAIVDETISRTNEAMSRNRSLRASQQVRASQKVSQQMRASHNNLRVS